LFQLPEGPGADFAKGDVFVRKQKTHRGAKKRFKVTGTGKLMRRRSHARHILTKKPRKRLRKLVSSVLVSESDKRKVKAMLNL
jgi:large subunit ribosomal protein L35